MDELINIIAELSNAVNTTSGWEIAGVIFSGAAVLGSLAVLIQNHKTIELSRRDIQNSINLQMFDKMMNIANKIEKDDYSITKMEIYTLFGKAIYDQIQKIIELDARLQMQKSAYGKYTNILNEEGYDWSLSSDAAQDDAPEDVLLRAEAQDKYFKEVPSGQLDPDGNPIYYNGNDILESIAHLESEIEDCKKCLKNNVYRITREKVKISDNTSGIRESTQKIPKRNISFNPKNRSVLPGFLICVTVLLIIAYVMFRLGFRITYNPSIITDWNAVSGCATWAGVIASIVAIWYAIQVPKKIACRQDKIALFEKRYELFHQLRNSYTFAHMLGDTDTIHDIGVSLKICYGIEKIEPERLHEYVDQKCRLYDQVLILYPQIQKRDIDLLQKAESEYFIYGVSQNQNEEEYRNVYIKATNTFWDKYRSIFKSYLNLDD